MKTIRDVADLRERIGDWHEGGESVALVPTMGNLHAGHLSLVKLAGESADRVVVSVFVNPSQFGPGEDLEAYPRTPERDRARLRRAGTDVLFLPADDVIYPFGVADMTRVTVPGLSAILCGASRPGHFDGVTSVVCRLFNIVQPDLAVFGEKDFQQLLIIRRMVADLQMPVRIQAAPISRAKDGLALSSRNQYLDEAERAQAPALYATLRWVADEVQGGRRDFAALEAEAAARLREAGLRPDYVAVRRASDLTVPAPGETGLVVLAAAYCGAARLIDNVQLAE